MLKKLIIHGGVSENPREDTFDILQAICGDAFARCGTALDAAVEAVRLMEEHPRFNAGFGCSLQADGQARMTASIMESNGMNFAGVVNIMRVRNPILVVRTLLGADSPILAGAEATAYAREKGFADFDPVSTERRAQWEKRKADGHGTVGAVALDDAGNIVAATSTGGRGNEYPGRVSDSGMPPGNYANPALGVSCTGRGEDIIRVALASTMAARVRDGAPLPGAVAKVLSELQAISGRAAFIALSAGGEIAASQSYGKVLYAVSPR
ncbi:MAG TPA: isoaspartyl peptidase/L-asparaginase [Candidatus Brocadiia bacterium]|nr:isoaspartyl peptidase/L-asparaginase [Candidatus Brocadiia bacterium]